MIRYKNKGQYSKRPNKAEFEFLYYDLNMKAEELANKYNVKIGTIYNWAHQFRLEEISQDN